MWWLECPSRVRDKPAPMHLPQAGTSAMAGEMESLSAKLVGLDFQLMSSDSVCQSGRVRWLGFDSRVGKAGVASLMMGLPLGQYQQLAPDLIYPVKDADATVKATLSRLQYICKQELATEGERVRLASEGDYATNYTDIERI